MKAEAATLDELMDCPACGHLSFLVTNFAHLGNGEAAVYGYCLCLETDGGCPCDLERREP